MIYEKYCNKCNEKTNHSIFHVTRTRGARLRCLSCGYKSERYYHIKKLKEIKNEI